MELVVDLELKDYLIGTKVGVVGAIFIVVSTLVFIILDRYRRRINFKKL